MEAERYGERVGVGFYTYTKTDAEPLETIIQRLQESDEVQTGTRFSVDRLMMPFFNEAARCVAEEIANVNDIDMACIAGIGMQVNKDGEIVRMGPLEYMDEVGLDVIVEKMEAETWARRPATDSKSTQSSTPSIRYQFRILNPKERN
jgi:hypothetical protein